MKYEKPRVMDIGARPALGQEPETCVSGPTADSMYETCAVGDTAGWACITGPAGANHPSCSVGGAAEFGGGDCVSGTVVLYYCEAGVDGDNDPNGCTAGPSFA